MKKILYISVNSKPESESSSKTVARKLINEVLCQCRYKVPKNKSTYTIDECVDNICEASNYKKGEECCQEHSHKHHHHHHENINNYKDDFKDEDLESQEVCCNELRNDTKCTDELKVDEKLKEHSKDKIIKNSDKEEVKEYNVETIETKEKHKAEVCCEDINEFIKDCSPDMHHHQHHDECCCGNSHDNDCCDGEHIHHHDSCCDDGHYYKNTCCCEDEVYEDKCCDTSDWEDCNEFVVEEIDLFKEYIPTLTHEFYECRNTLVGGPGPCYDKLTHVQRRDMAKIKELAIQFKEADIYIIAAPMWSLLFPAQLKQYLDCVILNGVTAEINEKHCKGTLDDKERKMVFVQSVGGELPIFLKCKLDHSNAYLKDISKFLGISKYTELLVDGTGYTEHEKQEAICEAMKDIPHIAKCLIK